ncbi:MAG: N-formylglutamate amidohydrolase [Alphaproteobacteria bacterium]|nr:MAG: N-formylglutamate amidohydrolase [Alphaproteobacteria bacterium]
MSDQKKHTEILRPQRQNVALVFDSPHSGSDYPADFNHACDMKDLRMAEDMYIDELFAHVTDHGAPLLKALFPRSYIDPNRAVKEQDNKDGSPTTLRGLFRTVCSGINPTPIYAKGAFPTGQQKQSRIDKCYREYHENLSDIIKDTKQQLEKTVHINCHSMPSTYGTGTPNNYDFILGDREGRSCAPELVAFVKSALEDMGYKVGVNIPGYRGAEIVKRYGDPANDVHSLQLEINRGLYMDERSFAKTANFEKLKEDLKTLTTKLAFYAAPKTKPQAKAPQTLKKRK